MSLKVTFPAGSNSETVRGLYQWDYGQVLEIESADIGSEIVEVHFACSNMSEAIVRSCAFSDGVGNVTIPDACLEQSTPVTAWIYQISGTQGHTSKTIILPITARTRPSVSRDIPIEVSDRYTELITEVNEAVEALENGSVTVAKATDATNANYAASAGNAATANFATTAKIAQYASADTKKGTIEERLTKLGFKEGVVTPVVDSAENVTVTNNVIQRQGNYVIGQFIAVGQFYAYTDTETNAYILPIGTVPKEFIPATTKTFYGYVKSINTSPAGAYISSGAIEITPTGVMRFANELVKSGCAVTEVCVSFGYDAAT